MILANYETQWLLEALKNSPESKWLPHVQQGLDVGFRPYLALGMNSNNTRNISYFLVIGYVFPSPHTVDSVLNNEHTYEGHLLCLRGYSFNRHGFEVYLAKYSGLNSVVPCGEHYPPTFITDELRKFFGSWIVDGLKQYAENASQEIEHCMDTVFESPSTAFPFNSGMEIMYHNYYFWLERVKLFDKLTNQHTFALDVVNNQLNALRTLIAGRIQRDGSKTTFKAKHHVDLPGDFAGKLLPLLNITGE